MESISGYKTQQDGRSGSTAPEVDRELVVIYDEVTTVSARAGSLATAKKQNGNTMDQRICERSRDRARCVAHVHGRLFDPMAASLQRRNDGEGDRTAAAVKFLATVLLRRTEGRAQTCELELPRIAWTAGIRGGAYRADTPVHRRMSAITFLHQDGRCSLSHHHVIVRGAGTVRTSDTCSESLRRHRTWTWRC
jgi:hypothetical protein